MLGKDRELLNLLLSMPEKDKEIKELNREITRKVYEHINELKVCGSQFLKEIMFINLRYSESTEIELDTVVRGIIQNISNEYTKLIDSYIYNSNSITNITEIINSDILVLKLINTDFKLLVLANEKFPSHENKTCYEMIIKLNEVGISRIQWAFV